MLQDFKPRNIRFRLNSLSVRGGGGQGVLTPPFPGPPLFICDPRLPPNPISR